MAKPDVFYAGKKVLVAGGTGTIGVPLVRTLVQRGAEVTVVSLDGKPYARKVLGNEARFLRSDLTQYGACLKVVRGQEYVFNLLGSKGSVGIGLSKAASYLVPMLRFQTNLMEAAFRCDVSRYMFVSSICAYPRSLLHLEDNLWDGLPLQNDRYAGIAKRVGEVQGEAYLYEYGWEAVRVARPANVYGPLDDFNPATAQVVPALIRRTLDGENPLKVWGDGSAIRDLAYSQDIAEGVILALHHGTGSRYVNLGSGRGYSVRELGETLHSFPPFNYRFDLTSQPAFPSG